jgi:hypothetical protein
MKGNSKADTTQVRVSLVRRSNCKKSKNPREGCACSVASAGQRHGILTNSVLSAPCKLSVLYQAETERAHTIGKLRGALLKLLNARDYRSVACRPEPGLGIFRSHYFLQLRWPPVNSSGTDVGSILNTLPRTSDSRDFPPQNTLNQT